MCWPTKWRSHCDHRYVTSLHVMYSSKPRTCLRPALDQIPLRYRPTVLAGCELDSIIEFGLTYVVLRCGLTRLRALAVLALLLYPQHWRYVASFLWRDATGAGAFECTGLSKCKQQFAELLTQSINQYSFINAWQNAGQPTTTWNMKEYG